MILNFLKFLFIREKGKNLKKSEKEYTWLQTKVQSKLSHKTYLPILGTRKYIRSTMKQLIDKMLLYNCYTAGNLQGDYNHQ